MHDTVPKYVFHLSTYILRIIVITYSVIINLISFQLKLGTDEINKWTSPRKSARASGSNFPKTVKAEHFVETENGEHDGDESDRGGRGVRRSLGGGERRSARQESSPKRKSLGASTNNKGSSSTGTAVGGRGVGGGGGSGRNSTGENSGGDGAGLGRTDLRIGGGGRRGGSGLDGEVEGPKITDRDLNTIKNMKNIKLHYAEKEKKLVSVQESIDAYQKHLKIIKKSNIDRMAAMDAEEEKRQAKKGKSKKKKGKSNKQIKMPQKKLEIEEEEKKVAALECLVKDEVCDAMEEGEEYEAVIDESKTVSILNSKDSLVNDDNEDVLETSQSTKEKDEMTDSTKDSKSSSDQENDSPKIDPMKKIKKKARGKFRLTTKTNKSKKFAVVQSDSFMKTFNKAIKDEVESSKIPQDETPNEEESLILRKTERERPLSKRLLQKKLLRSKLKELGKKLLEEAKTDQNSLRKNLVSKTQTSLGADKITTKLNLKALVNIEDEENYKSEDNNGEDINGDSSKTESPSGTPADEPDEIFEECLYKDECARKFCSYFSMMRHVAFFHRPERTAELMKLKLKK